MMPRVGSILWRNVGFACVAIVLLYCIVHAFDPPRLNWGDSYSDYNVMTAGRNFQKYGFLKMRLTPVLLDARLVTSADRRLIYTHYPQLPDLMNGVLRTVLRLSDLVQFRLVALAFSFGALFFIYRLIAQYWSRDIAQVSLALWVVNPLWIQHADYLHHGPYAAFFGFGGLYFLARYLADQTRRGLLIASGAFLFLLFFSSYDYWFFVPVLYALATICHYRTLNRRALGLLSILAAFAVAAVIGKFGTNAWALGGVGPLIQDLRFQWMERATSQAVNMSYTSGIWPTIVGRVERCFSLLLFPVAMFWLLAPILRRRISALRSGMPNPGLLFLAALPFLLVFIKLWVLQYYPTMLVLPFYAVASGTIVVLLADRHERLLKFAGITLFAALLGNGADEVLRFKKAFFERNAIRTLRAQLDTLSAPGQYILVNHMWDSAYGYYFDRNTVLLALNEPEHLDEALAYYTDPRRTRVAPPTGAIFVQHKHLADELFDKGFYYVLAREGLWQEWANPERYHARINAFINQRDSALVARVARVGRKVYDSDFYALWVIQPGAKPLSARGVETPAPSHRN
jgi:hypothetical protein